MTTISRDEFSQLQQRVTLLEGGNSAVQVQLTEQLRALNTQVSEVKQITTTGASSSEVQALNGKFDKLLDYLEAWVGVGNVNMDDIKGVVSGGSSSSSSSSTSTSSSSSALQDQVQALNTRIDGLVAYLQRWINVGNVNMNDLI